MGIERVAIGSRSVLIGVRCIFSGLPAVLQAMRCVVIGLPPTGWDQGLLLLADGLLQ